MKGVTLSLRPSDGGAVQALVGVLVVLVLACACGPQDGLEWRSFWRPWSGRSKLTFFSSGLIPDPFLSPKERKKPTEIGGVFGYNETGTTAIDDEPALDGAGHVSWVKGWDSWQRHREADRLDERTEPPFLRRVRIRGDKSRS